MNKKPSIGSYTWTTLSNGKLSMKEKLSLINQIMAPSMQQFMTTALRLDKSKRKLQFDDIAVPDTLFVKEAMGELEHYATPTLIAHSWRTYYWGAAFGLMRQQDFDPEMLLIGCLLHDLGLTADHASPECGCFTLASAKAANTWSQKVGYPNEKAELVADMICLHMNGHLEHNARIESRLLQQGASCDVIGAGYYQLYEDYRNKVLQQYPRQDFNRVFSQLLAQEAKQRPHSRTALLRQLGLPLMIRLNPFKQ
ncbi:HD domain-containing protein [Alkanindiges sp. WGS2144]|uniref:HD domain-containing protein n=1 Tax=Alkanindiges sp. WGS2144 TaxID=3366808 RepID=UPI0037517566